MMLRCWQRRGIVVGRGIRDQDDDAPLPAEERTRWPRWPVKRRMQGCSPGGNRCYQLARRLPPQLRRHGGRRCRKL